MAPLLFGESIMFPFNEKETQRKLEGTENSKGHSPLNIGDKPNIKIEKDQDDYNPKEDLNHSVHLCNRCWSTFVGIDAYFAHRNNGCNHSKESTNNRAQLDDINSRNKEGTCYINPHFPSTVQNIQQSHDQGNRIFEKDKQLNQDNQEMSISKKRNVNVLSPDQSAPTSNTQPYKKIKMSESSKELSRELAEILRKQMNEINNEYKDKQNSLHSSHLNNHSESIRIKLSESVRSSKELNLAESINAALMKQMQGLKKSNNLPNVVNSNSITNHNKDMQNSDLIKNPVEPISFHNKYSAAFNTRYEPTKKSVNHGRNITVNSPDHRLQENDKNETFHLKKSKTCSESNYSRSRSFEYKRSNKNTYNDCNITRKRLSSTRSKTLLIYNLNFDTRQEWLRKVFQRYGNVQCVNITRHVHVNRAKGYVEYEKLSDAEKAYKLCRNRIIDGSKIKITYYQYSLDSSSSRIDSGATEFGKEYDDRSTGYPLRRPIYKRNKRPGPYNLF